MYVSVCIYMLAECQFLGYTHIGLMNAWAIKWQLRTTVDYMSTLSEIIYIAQSAGAGKYTDYSSADG